MKYLLVFLLVLLVSFESVSDEKDGKQREKNRNYDDVDKIEHFMRTVPAPTFPYRTRIFRKMVKPGIVLIEGTKDHNKINYIKNKISEISEITKHEFRMRSQEKANIAIIFSDDFFRDMTGRYRDQLTKLFLRPGVEFPIFLRTVTTKKFNCTWRSAIDDPYILGGMIFIKDDLDQRTLSQCFSELFSVVIGVLGRVRFYKIYGFTNKNSNVHIHKFSELERISLRALYNENIKPGLGVESALKILKNKDLNILGN